MKIPKSFCTGLKMYEIKYVEQFQRPGQVGRVAYQEGRITLAHKYNITGRARTPTQMYHTFWHETIHAILNTMGEHRLCNNEKFVDTLACRLEEVFITAEF